MRRTATGQGRWTTRLAMAVILLTACDLRPGPFPVERGEATSEGGAEGIESGDDAGPVGDATSARQVGTACVANEDCTTAFCMTTENIGGFIRGAVVPNGYCSALFCAIDGTDGACTAGMGGTCFSLFPFLGESFGEQGICLAPCTGDAECRTADDNVCFDARTLVSLGLVDTDVIDRYYAEGSQGCLPRTVVDAAVVKLTPP